MNQLEKNVFTKEELFSRVKVPAIVERDLKLIITDRLEQCGLYNRVFSRIKKSSSLARKFTQKNYGPNHKIQDLVGVRINLYFDDDVEICKQIMEHTFACIEWSSSERSAEEFKPMKLNGIFRLPEYLKDEISSDTWDMYIDDTFEIQIKTMFFEGWHEIEHDMRYKEEELWENYHDFSRYFNSILATLELCDKSMITLLEDLSHALYKSGRWEDMIKSHFRLKLGESSLYPEIEDILNEDQLSGGDTLGKQIFRTPKYRVVDQLLKRTRKIPLNVNTIVAVLNESVLHDARLASVFKTHDVYNDGRAEILSESKHYELKPLARHTVFQMKTLVDGSRLKPSSSDPHVIFTQSASLIYQWVVQKYGMLFKDMPQTTATYHADIFAYHVAIHYDETNGRMNMHVRHMDPEIGGRIWYSESSLETAPDNRVYLCVCNGYAQPPKEGQDTSSRLFSYPHYYKSIVDSVGIYNGMDCLNRRRILKEPALDAFASSIYDRSRLFPIVLILSPLTSDGLLDEGWLGQFRVSDFTRTVWRYAHVITANEAVGKALFDRYSISLPSAPSFPGLYLFWPDQSIDIYGPNSIDSCSFGRRLDGRADTRTYDIVSGGKAFYYKILTELRDFNVSASMWKGFQLDILTEFPG